MVVIHFGKTLESEHEGTLFLHYYWPTHRDDLTGKSYIPSVIIFSSIHSEHADLP